MSPETKLYTTFEVSVITGLTLRQLQWWDERRMVVPRNDDHRRLYSEAQVSKLKKMAKLRKAGVSLQSLSTFLKIRTDWDSVVALKKPTIINGTLFVPLPE